MSRMKIKRSICSEIEFFVNPISGQKSMVLPGLVMYSIEDLDEYIRMLNRVKEVLNQNQSK
jgi:hypothetical protein